MTFPRLLMAALLLTIPTLVRADEKEDAAVLTQTLEEVRAALPAGWSAETRVEAAFRTESLSIKIQTTDPVPCKHVIFNPDSNESQPPPVKEIFEIDLCVCPFLTPEQFAAAKAKNDENDLRRRNAVKALKKAGVTWGFMGGMPPSAFHPQNDAQKQLVKEYALLWLNTEPINLPTHYRGTIAIRLDNDSLTTIDDAQREKERAEILNRVNSILTPYETKVAK